MSGAGSGAAAAPEAVAKVEVARDVMSVRGV